MVEATLSYPPRIKGASVHWRKACVRNPNPKSEPTAARNALQHQSVQRGYGAAHPPGIPSHFPSSPHLPDTNDRISRHRGGYRTSTRPFALDLAGAGPSQRRVRIRRKRHRWPSRGRPASKPKTRRRAMESNKTRPYEAAEGIATSPSGMSRRSFLAGAAAFGAGAAAFGLAGCQPNKDAEARRHGYGSHPRRKDAFQRSGAARLRRGGDRRWHIRHLCSSGCSPGGRQDRHRGENRPHWRPVELLHVHRGRRHCAPTGSPDTTSLPTSCMPHTANTTRAPAIFPWCAPSSTTLPIPSTGSWATGSGSSPAPKACRSSRTCPATKRCAAT